MEHEVIMGATQLQQEPGRELLSRVRAGLVRRGTSLSAWCREHGVHRQNARDCLIGKWNGPNAIRLRDRLVAAVQHEGNVCDRVSIDALSALERGGQGTIK